MAVVARLAANAQMEGLGELHGLFDVAVDDQVT